MELYRQGYIDQWDEWISYPSWKGEKTVQASAHYSMEVRLQLTVYGRYVRKGKVLDLYGGPGSRCKPYRWVARLRVEDVTHDVGSGSCKSLQDAIRKAKALDLVPHVKTLLRAFYSRERAMCVYRPRAGDQWDIIAHDGWSAWATSFSSYTDHEMGWPGGEYLVLGPRYRHRAYVSTYYCSSMSPELGKVCDLLPDWCRAKDKLTDEL